MGQLKASEVRLLVTFLVTILVLATFFGYEWYSKKLQAVNTEKIDLQAQRQSLLAMKTQEIEFNQKRAWLNDNQPIASDEFEAKENLDRILDVRGIEASGLTLISSPPEKAPSRETYYWAFERRVVVAGSIENIVQWLTQLQSESSFRVVTHLHLFPKKKTEPENLTCEVTIEQRYATREILAMSNVSVVNSPASVMAPTPEIEQDLPDTIPTSAQGSQPATPAAEPVRRPQATLRPPSFNQPPPPADGEAAPPSARPRVRLPGASNPPTPPTGGNETSLISGSKRTGFASADGRVIRGGPTPPPLMADDRDASGGDASTGVELVPDAISEAVAVVETLPRSVPTDSGVGASAPDIDRPFDSVNPNAIVGEDWDATSPGADGIATSDSSGFASEVPQTN